MSELTLSGVDSILRRAAGRQEERPTPNKTRLDRAIGLTGKRGKGRSFVVFSIASVPRKNIYRGG